MRRVSEKRLTMTKGSQRGRERDRGHRDGLASDANVRRPGDGP